jgi:hypothetical protein
MELTQKISLPEAIYLAFDEMNEQRFITYLRYAQRAIENFGVYPILVTKEEKHTIKQGRFTPIPDYFYIRSVSVNGIKAIISNEQSSIQGLGYPSSQREYLYTVEDGNVLFEKQAREFLENQQADVDYRVFDRNSEGDILVPIQMQECIIWFIRKEEAYKRYMASNGREGRGLYNDSNSQWLISRTEALNDIETPSEDEIALISMIWKTKSPLNYGRGYRDFNKIH